MERIIHLDSTSLDFALPATIVSTLDAIFVLGGGVPETIDDPPTYVKERCKVAAKIFNLAVNRDYNAKKSLPSILTLSAGTAHLAQLISSVDGLPIWESTASASYLINKLGIDERHVYVETSSYDTISNAFFARTSFADIAGWETILVITNEFHIDRTKAIFDWVFEATDELRMHHFNRKYRLYYVSCPNVGLSELALQVRRERETNSTHNVREKLSAQYPTLQGIWQFLTRKHDFYNAKKLTEKGKLGERNRNDLLLKDSYGGLKTPQSVDSSKQIDSISPRKCYFTKDYVRGLITGTVMVSSIILFIAASRNRKISKNKL